MAGSYPGWAYQKLFKEGVAHLQPFGCIQKLVNLIGLARNIFLSIGLSQGLRKSVSILALIKLKKAERWAYLMRLVCCFLPSVIPFRNSRISSVVMVSMLLPPKSWLNREKSASYDLTVFFL
jgi:hypothetical protein